METMRPSRLSGILYLVMAAFMLSLIVVPPASAQPAEGQIIQTPDGALWVMDGGSLHAATPVQMDYPDLLGVPIGVPADHGVTLRGPAAGQLTEAPPAMAPMAAAPTGPFGVDVIQIERPLARSGNPGTGQEWVRIRIRLTNLSDRSVSSSIWSSAMRLQLADGTTVNAPRDSASMNIPDVFPISTLQVGSTTEGNTVFSVPVGRPITKVLWTIGGDTVEAPIP